jgi:hypothetical protein
MMKSTLTTNDILQKGASAGIAGKPHTSLRINFLVYTNRELEELKQDSSSLLLHFRYHRLSSFLSSSEDLPFSVAEDWSCCVLAGFNLAIWGGISLFSSSGDWDISCCVNANKGGNGPPPLGNAVDSSRNSSKNG